MRVTTGAYRSHYLKNSNAALENQLNIIDRIQSGRKYNRASEDSVSAAKAAHVRKSLENLHIYNDNVKTAKAFFQASEDALYDIANSTYLDINEKITSAQDTKDQDQLNILAQDIESMADHIMQDMNSDFAERQMFGSMSNDKTPFTVYGSAILYDKDGNKVAEFTGLPECEESKSQIIYSDDVNPNTNLVNTSRVVCYNDYPVSITGDMLKAAAGGRIEYTSIEGKPDKTVEISENAPSDGLYTDFPGSGPIYVDIGLGINYAPDKIASTALDVSLNGAKITGCGVDKEGDPRNLIQLCYDAANALRAGDTANVNKYIDKLASARDLVLTAITDLGIQQNNMDYHLTKNETYELSLSEKQNDLESVDFTEEITKWKSAEAAYNATLSMGSSSLPKSLFDFI